MEDIYELDGDHHSCNPGSVVRMVTPYSKNRRVITIFDTEPAGASGVGLVAMIEVVALMVGKIRQCYSRHKYENPAPVKPGMFLEKGRPKSLFLPGSSTVIAPVSTPADPMGRGNCSVIDLYRAYRAGSALCLENPWWKPISMSVRK